MGALCYVSVQRPSVLCGSVLGVNINVHVIGEAWQFLQLRYLTAPLMDCGLALVNYRVRLQQITVMGLRSQGHNLPVFLQSASRVCHIPVLKCFSVDTHT